MIRLTDSHSYKTSRDYKALYDLVKTTSVICLVSDGYSCRSVASSIISDSGIIQISSRGLCYLWTENRDDFIEQCKGYDLEYIVPDKES